MHVLSVLICTNYLRILLFLFASLMFSGCQSYNETDYQIFVDSLNKGVGKPLEVSLEQMIEWYEAGLYENVKLINVQEKNSETHLLLEYWDKGCRVGEVYKDDVMVDWYFVANERECYVRTGWLGPW